MFYFRQILRFYKIIFLVEVVDPSFHLLEVGVFLSQELHTEVDVVTVLHKTEIAVGTVVDQIVVDQIVVDQIVEDAVDEIDNEVVESSMADF